MKPQLKKVKDQVMVITGASSGIGLATAHEAAKRGARVVLASRNEEDLQKICEDIRNQGGNAEYIVADVADPQQVQRIADLASAKFGGFDTWINNAAASTYGRLQDVPVEEKRRLFDVNFWGVVYGCKAAVRELKSKGGAIINLGSEVSEHSLPLQGIYSASKHAVKAYTHALRIELEKEGAPVSVTLIKPASIDTLFPVHAQQHMEQAPELPPPVYAPEVVAKAIVACAEKPIRSLFVGGSGVFFASLEKLSPWLSDAVAKVLFFDKQKAKVPRERDEGLMQPPRHEGRVHGGSPYRVRGTSYYTAMALHPVATKLVAAGLGAAAIAFNRNRRRQWRKAA